MHDWTPRVIAILRNYMRDPTAGVAGSMALNDLAIDLLDLPLIYLDLEDAFDVDIDLATSSSSPQPSMLSPPASQRA